MAVILKWDCYTAGCNLIFTIIANLGDTLDSEPVILRKWKPVWFLLPYFRETVTWSFAYQGAVYFDENKQTICYNGLDKYLPHFGNSCFPRHSQLFSFLTAVIAKGVQMKMTPATYFPHLSMSFPIEGQAQAETKSELHGLWTMFETLKLVWFYSPGM